MMIKKLNRVNHMYTKACVHVRRHQYHSVSKNSPSDDVVVVPSTFFNGLLPHLVRFPLFDCRCLLGI